MKKVTLENLKNELLGKKITLLELDNYMVELMPNATSLFEQEEQAIEEESWAYQFNENENYDGFNICFDIIEKNEDNFKIIVKVTNIEEI